MTRTAALLDRLVRHETVSSRSNLDLVEEVEALLRSLGARTARLPDAQAPKAGLYAEIGPPGPGGLLLSAHSDVVPVEGQDWSRAPFRLSREADRLYGRGTTDMKGFLAAMLAAAERAAGRDLTAPLKLVISYDEEVGCVGIARMLGRLASLVGSPDLAIVGEPTEMQVATGHKGKRAYRALIRGEAGHSALAPHFVNALYVAAEFVGRLKALGDDLARDGGRDEAYSVAHSTLHVGMLNGGRALNIVPDHAEIVFEIRYLTEDDPNVLEQRIRHAADGCAAAHGPGAAIEVAEINAYPGLEVTDAKAIEIVTAAALTGTCKVPFGTEAGFFSGLGIPTLVCGPGSMAAQGHTPDEFITDGHLAACAAVLDRIVSRMTGA